jgi:transposase
MGEDKVSVHGSAFGCPDRIYALRNRIERFINRLKNSRRVAARCDQTPTRSLGFAALASISLWIGFVHVA